MSGLTFRQRAMAAGIAAVGVPVIALLGRSLRWRVEGFEHYEAVCRSGRQPIFAFWHGRILPATYFWRRRDIVVMTSSNFDGEWIARIIRRFGYATARGSTSRGGRRALAQMRREMRAGRPAAFTVDGPRGPARSVQPGAIWLASLSGNPVLPFHIEASRYWEARSWDATQFPQPYSLVTVAIGAPLEVPSVASSEVLDACRVDLEQRLAHLADRASRMLSES